MNCTLRVVIFLQFQGEAYYFDQPFGGAANILLYLMAKELKGSQKVTTHALHDKL